MTKKPSSGVGIGLWVAGALVAVYVLGGVLIYADYRRGFTVYVGLPSPVKRFLGFIYTPVFTPIAKAWPELFPLDS